MSDLIFTDAHAREAFAAAIPALKPGNTKVLVASVDQQGVQVAAAFEFVALKADWELKAVARHDWSGANLAAGDVIIQWR
jgi:hypothetical protein